MLHKLTIKIEKSLAKKASEKAKNQGTTLTFILTQALKSFVDDEFRMMLVPVRKKPVRIPQSILIKLEANQKRTLKAIAKKSQSTEELMATLQLSAQEAIVAVGFLEIHDLIEEYSGKWRVKLDNKPRFTIE